MLEKVLVDSVSVPESGFGGWRSKVKVALARAGTILTIFHIKNCCISTHDYQLGISGVIQIAIYASFYFVLNFIPPPPSQQTPASIVNNTNTLISPPQPFIKNESGVCYPSWYTWSTNSKEFAFPVHGKHILGVVFVNQPWTAAFVDRMSH